jgi:hypothetical protein
MKLKRVEKAIFTILIAFAIVAFWRGTWGLLDVYLFPENYALSSLISVATGIIILLSTKHLLKDLV